MVHQCVLQFLMKHHIWQHFFKYSSEHEDDHRYFSCAFQHDRNVFQNLEPTAAPVTVINDTAEHLIRMFKGISIFNTLQKLYNCSVCLTLTFDTASFLQLNVSSIVDQANSAAF